MKSYRRRLFGPILLGLAALAAGPVSLEDEAENYRQLEAMPRERRIALAANLERFDKLSSAEQSAIRKLNAEIAKKDPVEQLRYRSYMHRYHLWVNGLSEAQKQTLDEASSPEGRFEIARKIRQKELQAGPQGPRIFGIRTGHFGLQSPHESAHLLEIWGRLGSAEKAKLEKVERKYLFDSIKAEGLKTPRIPNHGLPHHDEEKYDAQLDTSDFRTQLGSTFARRVDAIPKKSAAAQAKNEPIPKRFELHYGEFLYYEDHKPKPVMQANLERFSASCPNWFHAMLDPLSPDDARAYLTIVYRLIYKDTGDIPADTKSSKNAPPPSPAASKPATRKSGNAGPL